MARTVALCACKHKLDNRAGTPVPGSGTLVDPYIHEKPRIASIKKLNGEYLVPDADDCIQLPETMFKAYYDDDTETVLPDEDGTLDLQKPIYSWNVSAWRQDEFLNSYEQQTKFVPIISGETGSSVNSEEDILFTIVGHADSGNPYYNTHPTKIAAQWVKSDGEGSNVYSMPQYARNTTYKISSALLSPTGSVNLWPDSTVKFMSVSNENAALLNTEFGIKANFGVPAGEYVKLGIYDADNVLIKTLYWGQFNTHISIISYSFVFHKDFSSSLFPNSGQLSLRVISSSQPSFSYSFEIVDILTTYRIL